MPPFSECAHFYVTVQFITNKKIVPALLLKLKVSAQDHLFTSQNVFFNDAFSPAFNLRAFTMNKMFVILCFYVCLMHFSCIPLCCFSQIPNCVQLVNSMQSVSIITCYSCFISIVSYLILSFILPSFQRTCLMFWWCCSSVNSIIVKYIHYMLYNYSLTSKPVTLWSLETVLS